MIRSICLAVALMVACPAVACAQDAAREVEAAYASWDAAFNRSDAEGVSDAYTQEALFLAPDHEVRKGPKVIQAFFDGLFKNGVTGHQLILIETGGDGEFIYATARWKAQIKGENGASKEIGGIGTHVFERQADGSLKLKIHSFN